MTDPTAERARLAEAVRAACLHAARDAFEDASLRGLCCTGAWEVAVGAIQTLDVESLLPDDAPRPDSPSPPPT